MRCRTIDFVVFMTFALTVFGKKKDSRSAKEFLDTEEKRIAASCPLKKITQMTVNNLRYQKSGSTTICLVKYLQENQGDGLQWAALGSLYSQHGKAATSQADVCFKQAGKLLGKLSPFVQEWHYLGPFVTGKTEFDGDPVEVFGGIQNVSQFRLQKSATFPSELVPGGEVKWSVYSQTSPVKIIQITPKLNWNDLVSSLGSLGITEWQGWLVGEFAITEDGVRVVIQCFDVSTFYVDDRPYVADVYHRDRFQSSVPLARGIHTLYIHVRAKVTANIKCTLLIAPKSFELLKPSFYPDIYRGRLFGKYISVVVANYHATKWLTVSKVTLVDQSEGEPLSARPVQKHFSVAPGQIRPLTVVLVSESEEVQQGCKEIDFDIKLSTSEGPATQSFKLRCRNEGESFLFTFIDHDGSLQHAAAVEPIAECASPCPTVLSLHGTTVPPQNQADSYKRMVDGKFVFGVERAWLLAPTRHGAHNWEGPGALTAMTALQSLADVSQELDWIQHKADPLRVVFTGHSMGGHGAWHLASHFPDRALAVVALAGWIKKEEYGDSNLFFKHDLATSHTDPAVKAILEASIAENDADRHVTNLRGIPVLTRVGAADRTTHPFYSRRIYRLLVEAGVNVNYTELPNKEHWWWDTWETNDGGAVNDAQIRDFLDKHLPAASGESSQCSGEGEECGKSGHSPYSRPANEEESFQLVIVNPALGEGLKGVRVLRQHIPLRTSKVEGQVGPDSASMVTTNVAVMSLSDPPNRSPHWSSKSITVDGTQFSPDDVKELLENNKLLCSQKSERQRRRWTLCQDDLHPAGSSSTPPHRSPHTLGPARRVAEKEFVIVTGTQGNATETATLLASAVYIANLFLLTADTATAVLQDTETSDVLLENKNLIIVGGPRENSVAEKYLDKIPIKVIADDGSGRMELGDCSFSDPRTGVLTLTPNGQRSLALVLAGNSLQGLADVVRLATPTIPPMTRSPFSNLLPDYVVTGPQVGWKGPGGWLCAGFWGNDWSYRLETSSCFCPS